MTRRKNTCSRLRHRLTLQQEAETPDGAGGYARTWQNIADVWAEIIPVGASVNTTGGKEFLFAEQLQAEVTHRVLLRYRDAVTAGMRLFFEERAFNIVSVVNTDESGETLEILTREGGAA